MAQLFRVQGFSVAAARTVEVFVWAQSAEHARKQVQASGLRFVTVTEWTVDSPTTPRDAPPMGSSPDDAAGTSQERA